MKLIVFLLGAAAAFQAPLSRAGSAPQVRMGLKAQLTKLATSSTALAIAAHANAAHAKKVLGVNGALDFGALAGDQPGGEGTGRVRAAAPRLHAAPPARDARAHSGRRRAFSGTWPLSQLAPPPPHRVPLPSPHRSPSASPASRHAHTPALSQALGVDDDILYGVLLVIPVVIGLLFNQWQGYQEDDQV